MSTATIRLNMNCSRKGCKHSFGIEVCITVAKGAPAVSLQTALEAAGVPLGYARVHVPGSTPQVFCASCKGPVACRRCGFDPCGCLGVAPAFDVDRYIEEGVTDADRG